MRAQQAPKTHAKFIGLNFQRIGRRDGRDLIGIDNAGFERGELFPIFDIIPHGAGQPCATKHIPRKDTLEG